MERSNPKSWRATLTPHRSLTRSGFIAVMSVIVAANFIAGLVFYLKGAWPVMGFCGLDVALVWYAFHRNFADARRAERIGITDHELILEQLAERSGVRPHPLQRLFTRWAGLSPKAFLQAITIDHARELLRDSASILDTAYEVGLSGPGRLHDLFVTHEGMSPGFYKARGKGLTISYGFHDCQFGRALVMATNAGLCGLAFADAGQE